MAVAKWSTSVISTLSSDTEPTIIITFDNAKYIFNAGENTGRAWIQSRAYWRRVKAVFFTQVGTQRMSGMPGLLMFIADGGISNLHLVGPQGLTHALAALRLYTYRQNMGITPVEVKSISPPTGTVKPKPTYTDKNITVYSIPLFPEVDEDGNPIRSLLQQDSSLKRKRRASSASPPRRNRDADFSAETGNLPLKERMRLNGFLPTNLVGEDAERWREMTVENMFPAKNSESGKEADEDVDADPPYVLRRHPGSFNPAGSDKQLPKMNFTKDSEAITSKQKPSLAYIVVGPKTRGKFDAKKADELGLKGKLRGLVANGTTVNFTTIGADGKETERTVKPEECVGPGDNPAVVIILDIPTTAHIPAAVSAFTKSDFYAKFRSRKAEDRIEYLTNVVYHLCGPDVIENPRYQAFMRGFNSSVNHIVASREHCPDPVTFTNAAFNQLQFNRLNPNLFPIPKFSLKASRPLENFVDKFDFESGMGSAEPGLPPKTYVMAAGMNTGVRPFLPPKVWDSEEKFHPAATELAAIREANMAKRPVGRSTPTQKVVVEKEVDVKGIEFDKKILSPAAFRKFKEAKAAVKVTPPGAGTGPGRANGGNVKVIPLGTSSALPSKYRNVSGYLIRIPKHGSILLEAGEGTWGQMCRFFGTDPDEPNNVREVLRDIKVIFISHAHGDHHFGLSKILSMRKQLDPPPTEPLFLVTLHSIILGLKELSDIEDMGFDYVLHRSGVVPIYSPSLVYTQPEDERGGYYQAMCKSLGLKALTTVEVRHRTRACGVVIDHQDGWRIVFSGDTQPTEVLAEAGKNAKLLIHEATMADDQVELARIKAHSTVGQAIEIGRKMNAEKILLTHFSARYPKMPPQIVDQDVSPTTPTSPLTALFRSPPSSSSSTSPISALPDVPTDSTTSPPSPTTTSLELKPKAKEKKRKQPIIGLAFDHMNITLGEFWKLRAYLPAMDQAFGKDEKDKDEDSEERIMKMID